MPTFVGPTCSHHDDLIISHNLVLEISLFPSAITGILGKCRSYVIIYKSSLYRYSPVGLP